MREFVNFLIATIIMTAVFVAVIYYLIPMPFTYALTAGFVVAVVTVMVHEFMHRIYATELCDRRATFTLTYFALVITMVSIFILSVLILIKQYTGWYTYFIPIIASPGGVYVAMRKADKCYDNIAIVAPLYNFIVGVIALLYLFEWSSPPFILNDVSNFTVSLVALIAYFSFALAFLNALPIKIGDVATDGYWALMIDKNDVVTKITAIVIVFVSFVVLFLTGWWGIVLY